MLLCFIRTDVDVVEGTEGFPRGHLASCGWEVVICIAPPFRKVFLRENFFFKQRWEVLLFFPPPFRKVFLQVSEVLCLRDSASCDLSIFLSSLHSPIQKLLVKV